MDKKLSKNLFLSIGYNILTVIVPFLTAPYLGRVLGAENVGSYTYVYSIASYFVIFGILGMRTYGNRTIAKVRENQYQRSKSFWEVWLLQVITCLIIIFAYFMYAVFICKQHILITYILGMYVVSSVCTVDWFCEGMELFQSLAKRTLLVKILNLVSIFAFVHNENDLILYTIIMSLGYLVSSILLWPSVLKSVTFVIPSIKDVFKHLVPNILLFIPTIASSVYQTMDKIMIGGIASKTELAYYEYAEKIIQIPLLLFTAMGAVMLSRMSHMFQKDEGEAFDTLSYSMDLTCMISSSFCFGLAAVSYELINVYYGSSFAPSGPILMALAPMIIMYGWANVIRMQYVIPNNLNHIYIIATIAGAIVNFILNLIFIPNYQAVGATIGTLAAQFTVALVFTICVRKKLPIKAYMKRELPVLLIGLIMGITVFMVSQTHKMSVAWLFVDVAIGAVVFGLLYIVYGIKTKGNLANKMVSIVHRKMMR